MFCFVKDDLCYIKIPKNACMSHMNILKDQGFKEYSLYENDLDLSQYYLFGYISEPNARHTKGLVQYLINTKQEYFLNHNHRKMLVSGIFDEHTMSIFMMVPDLIDKINWIPLDQNGVDSDLITQELLLSRGMEVDVKSYERLNPEDEYKKALSEKVNELKVQYNDEYQKLVQNFLNRDIILYNKVLAKYTK